MCSRFRGFGWPFYIIPGEPCITSSAARCPTRERAVLLVGQLGLLSLAVVFGIIALFLIVATLHHNPNEAKGLGDALQQLAQEPFGPLLLAAVALGLMTYGVFSFAEARYRRLAGK